MKILNLTFDTPEENLACDEALLEEAENENSGEVLRFWEAKKPFVVLGYSNKVSEEVNLTLCQKNHIPILRRTSGGGTVLQGPGCLNYALILKIQNHEGLKSVTQTNHFIMNKHSHALQSLTPSPVIVRGITDLAMGDLKFSGNAQRRKRRFILFHGTFLLNFKLSQIEKFLPLPPRRPEYRKNRPHKEFLTNFNVSPEEIKKVLIAAWNAAGNFNFSFSEKMKLLIADHYSKEEWNFRF